MADQPNINTSGGSGQILKDFQLDNLTISQKSDYYYGKRLAQYIFSTINGGTSSYFWIRNARYRQNRNYANGKVNMTKFQDLLEFNGKENYINLNWQSIKIVNRIVSGLVGRWMGRNEKIQVTATDPYSQKQKEEIYSELEFYIDNRDHLLELQEQSGVQMVPQGDNLPENQDELLLWKSQFLRLPEEIAAEMASNEVLAANGWFDVLKEKLLHDSAETGFVGTETYLDESGNVVVGWLKPENCFYSYSDYPDFRDTTWRGVLKTRKISYLRRKYGKEFNPDNPHALTEEQLFNIAATSKEYQLYDNLTWLTMWNVTFIRPYDEWNVTVLEFEVKTVDKEPYTIVKTKKNGSTIVKRGATAKPKENEVVREDSYVNIYRGVYELSTMTLCEWGLKKNMIRPNDPKESGNAEFSYSFYMVQNYDMTSLAIPEKIQEPADMMILSRLKMQQLVAKMRPAGAAINWDALQNIDFGLGDQQNKTLDIKKLYDQTGEIYYRGRDAEGRPNPVPITELQNTGFIGQMQALIQLYEQNYKIMKDELGEDPNLITAAAQPRVAVGNIEASQQQAEFATDYFYHAYVRVMEDSCKKVLCLLDTSVRHGAAVYRKLLKEEDVKGKYFSTKIQLLPDEVQIAKFEAYMQASRGANPDLTLFVNPFRLMRVAREDVKLAETMFTQGQKKMLLDRRATAAQNQDATFKAQVESGRVTEQEKRETEKLKMQNDLTRTITQTQGQMQTSTVTGILDIYKECLKQGIPLPEDLKPLAETVLTNVAIPAFMENEQVKKMFLQNLMQGGGMQEGAEQGMEGGQPMPQEMGQPQEQTETPIQ